MDKNELNKSTLSKACNIPYTTIDGWYKKGYEGLKLSTLRKLANFFGTTLDFWANDNSQFTELSTDKRLFIDEKDEIELLHGYRLINKSTKAFIKGMIKGFVISEKITNNKGKAITIPEVANLTDEIINSFDELKPKYQQAIVELIEQLLVEQEQDK